MSGSALANELDVLNEPPPTRQHVIDDAGVINKTNRKGLNDELTRLEVRCNYASQFIRIHHNTQRLMISLSKLHAGQGIGMLSMIMLKFWKLRIERIWVAIHRIREEGRKSQGNKCFIRQ